MAQACQWYREKRFRCHNLYGKQGDECYHAALSEKRCISLQLCQKQAKEYYGDALMGSGANDEAAIHALSNKGLCASWAESFAYADKELEYGPEVTERHQKAREIVRNDPNLKRECREKAVALAMCLRHKKF